MRRRKHFFGPYTVYIDVLRMQSRENITENLMGEFKNENFKKIRKNEVSEFFFSDFTSKTPPPSIRSKKKTPHDYFN